ncbi:MAG: hypothetical protein NC453_12895 [Muribaculum sp.]|nr:hypothetical protein [Muribaculum sp.]
MFTYQRGREGVEVIERNNFQQSIFSRQYRNALKIVGEFLDATHPDSENRENPKIVCFCGDRGEGKSSCMRTVAEILKSSGDKASSMSGSVSDNKEANSYLDSLSLGNVKKTSFFSLDIMDPSYFDNDHNILELVVGEIYKKIRQKAEKDGVSLDRIAYNNLTAAAKEVKESLFYIHKDCTDSFSEITQLNLLAASVNLKKSVRNMVSLFLKFIGADILLLEIDDLDMNMAGTYEMCEQIRNYLSFPECIIFMAAKYSQLEYAVELRMHKMATARNQEKERIYFRDLARKYLLKFLPVQIRIFMPKLYEGIVNQSMRVCNLKNLPIEQYKSVKEGVVKLIFRKTRFLFYNSRGGVSLIIPNNLRQLVSLLDLLYGMEDINGDNLPTDVFLQNKEVFKNYFYYSWSAQLPSKYRDQISKWVEDTSLPQMNKSVVNWLTINFKQEIERTYGDHIDEEDETSDYEKAVRNNITEIENGNNFSYNVTTGDVFYLLSLLSLDFIDPDREKMMFFIRSMYSILLYEEYDVVTYEIENPSDDEQNVLSVGIFKKDPRFEAANVLQRILNGAYFNYIPGELLPTDSSRFLHFDTRVIKGAIPSPQKNENPDAFAFADLLKECDAIIKSYSTALSEYREKVENSESKDEADKIPAPSLSNLEIDTIRLAEFFMLTISRSIRNGDIENFYSGSSNFRHESSPANLEKFNPQTGYYIFDILAPFYNLANPQFCYDRYSNICEGFYQFALNYKGSLLRELIEVAAKNRGNIDATSNEGKIHALLSDAIIRNGEILTAIFENAKAKRYENHWNKGLNHVSYFYAQIENSNMETYERGYGKKDYHRISFSFLEPLKNYINFLDKTIKSNNEISKIFNAIFDRVENDRRESKVKDANSEKRMKRKGYLTVKRKRDTVPDELKDKIKLLTTKLKELFGDRELGSNDNVIGELRLIDANSILAGKRNRDILPATKQNNYVNYNVGNIMDVLLQPHLEKNLHLWLKFFDIE